MYQRAEFPEEAEGGVPGPAAVARRYQRVQVEDVRPNFLLCEIETGYGTEITGYGLVTFRLSLSLARNLLSLSLSRS
jgi:hypothetical protein